MSTTSATSTRTADREAYLKHLLGQAIAVAEKSELDLESLRSRAHALVSEQSFPSGRDEEWRFTDLSEMLAVPFPAAAEETLAADALESGLPWLNSDDCRLTSVNGHYAPALSLASRDNQVSTNLPEGAVVAPLSALMAHPDFSRQIGSSISARLAQIQGGGEVFTALNTAGFADVMVVWLRADQVLDQPVHIVRASQAGAIAHLRTLVIAERHASFTLVESFWGDDEQTRCNNSVTEIWLEAGAQVNHIRLQNEGAQTFHIAKTAVSQAADSRYQCTAIDLGAKLSRHHLEVYQTGPQTDTHLYGLSALSDRQLADTHSLIALTHPHSEATQIQKNIVDDRAHSVFNGRVLVSQAAQMTNASQLNRNLLLSSKARVDTKPELDIVADNVKCAHGATVSQLQADEVFYLQSRGISAEQAQRLLLYGFAMEIVEKITFAPLRQSLSDRLTRWTR
ncbi:Fe-S cluster assembly protein SufD [Leptolyngbya sp. BC1307]|uniref:Fe-S cluster assembly protein SufD n=1 Tax=Leptolyngbya sp. BC1307 TaxID=2029589 RepID=UPI000EFCAB3D|nr:Fe-S cluster assembly protein SufD [Leptolyngbya sp. BC1307]